MAIEKMRRVRLICPKDDGPGLLEDLMRLGCVEVSEPADLLQDTAWQDSLRRGSADSETLEQNIAKLASALECLRKYAPVKKKLLAPRPEVRERAFFSPTGIQDALDVAEIVNYETRRLEELSARARALEERLFFLLPWQNCGIPLDEEGGKSFSVLFGTCPAFADIGELRLALEEAAPECVLYHVSSDKEQHMLVLAYHKSREEDVTAQLKAAGFGRTVFKDIRGTADENIAHIRGEMADNERESGETIRKIRRFESETQLLRQVYDAEKVLLDREKANERTVVTAGHIVLSGWCPLNRVESVENVLLKNGCAYEFCEPSEEDDVPVSLKKTGFFGAFNQITEMYGLPSYYSLIDPNMVMAPFFFLFFGIMLSDAAYGVLLFFACFFALKKLKPEGAMKGFLTMFMLCGVSTFFFGILFWSWFGDAPSVILNIFFQKEYTPPSFAFDMAKDPMTSLVLACGFGFIHILFGMGVSAVRMILRGQWVDALCDVGSWYLLFAGLVVYALGIVGINTGNVGLYIAGAGALAVVATGGRANKGIGKLTGGLGSLYGITSYIADILSYSRLFALGLATGVVSSVFNSIGSIAGGGFIGIILFLVVFVIGHTFNLAINALGSYVHSSRLQYVEFFGKFYETGGKPFVPFARSTKFVRVVNED